MQPQRSTSIQPELVSYNPATLEEVGRVKTIRPADLDAIVAEAASAQKRWAETPVRERAQIVGRAADHVLGDHARLAELITRENGKTLSESYMMEISTVLDCYRWIAKSAERLLAPEPIPTPQLIMRQKKHSFVHTAIGVVGIISPWNYPYAIPATGVALALVAGNAVILKPASLTPLIGEAIKDAFVAAGLPEGLLTVVHGGGVIGGAMCDHPGIGKIAFTGSVEVGYTVAQKCASSLKPCTLELGGKDAAVVLHDADLERAARGLLWGGAANCGQTCAGVERVYVARPLYDDFVARIAELASRLRVGDPLDLATEVGPLTAADQYETVAAQVEDAVARGARKLSGGPVDVGLPGKWYAPAVVTGVDHTMRIMREETFGPLIPVMPFDDEDEAVALANDSEFGLGASVWSRDKRRATAIALRLESGMVWVNDHMYSYAACQLPWGGVKKSGLGVTHSKHGLLENTHTRLLGVDSGRMPVTYWHPYDERLYRGLQAALKGLYGASRIERIAGLVAGHRELIGLAKRALESRRGH